jgi:heat shock protein HtpX
MLILFPCIILLLTWVFFLITNYYLYQSEYQYSGYQEQTFSDATFSFLHAAPWVIGVCLVWFLIAYFANTVIINSATGSKPLERRDNKRVYNLVENLCMTTHMDMPKINVIEDSSLNAFASGLNKKTFTVTLSRGIIDRLNDQELEAVIAHELTHIRNNDVKVLIVSIVFVGIFSFLTQILFRTLLHGRFQSRSNNKNEGGGAIVLLLIALLLAAIGYFFTILMRFAISRNREYMADAGSAEMTKNPLALASALRKISADPYIEAVERKDVAQLFIDNPLKKGASFINEIFATHPPINKRIKVLEQF